MKKLFASRAPSLTELSTSSTVRLRQERTTGTQLRIVRSFLFRSHAKRDRLGAYQHELVRKGLGY